MKSVAEPVTLTAAAKLLDLTKGGLHHRLKVRGLHSQCAYFGRSLIITPAIFRAVQQSRPKS